MVFKTGDPPGPGRPPGQSNKATTIAREAIAKFVDGNAHKFGEWLEKVADGVKRAKPTAQQIKDGDIWEKKPNPEAAFQMLQSVLEYHVPKLARTELTGEDGTPLIPCAEDDKANLERYFREKFKREDKDK